MYMGGDQGASNSYIAQGSHVFSLRPCSAVFGWERESASVSLAASIFRTVAPEGTRKRMLPLSVSLPGVDEALASELTLSVPDLHFTADLCIVTP